MSARFKKNKLDPRPDAIARARAHLKRAIIELALADLIDQRIADLLIAMLGLSDA